MLALTLAGACSVLVSAATAASGDVLGFSTFLSASTERDVFFDVAEAPDGSVYAVGNQDQDPSGGTMLLVKFDAARNLLWQRTYRPAGAIGAWASVVATDAAGNAVVGGGSTDGADADIAVVKWSAAGTRLWTAIRDGGGSDWVSDIAVAADGRVCVCGDIEGNDHAIVLQYAADAEPANPLTGKELWQYQVHSTASYAGASAMALTVDRGGNVYVVGERASASAERNAFALKLSRAGVRRWLRTWDGAGHDNDSASRVVLKGQALYVGADTSTKKRDADLALIKYSTAGDRRWVRVWDNGRNSGDNIAGLACDGRGRVYVSVNSGLPDGVQKGFLIRFTAAGKRLWQRAYQGVSGVGGSYYYDVAVTRGGTAWVGGYVTQPTAITRWLTVKYSADGKRRWVRTWDGPPATPLGGQAWTCRLIGASSFVMAGEVRTASGGPAACVLWRQR
jgi:hypothetical protein